MAKNFNTMKISLNEITRNWLDSPNPQVSYSGTLFDYKLSCDKNEFNGEENVLGFVRVDFHLYFSQTSYYANIEIVAN
jgi:hypothetical protein